MLGSPGQASLPHYSPWQETNERLQRVPTVCTQCGPFCTWWRLTGIRQGLSPRWLSPPGVLKLGLLPILPVGHTGHPASPFSIPLPLQTQGCFACHAFLLLLSFSCNGTCASLLGSIPAWPSICRMIHFSSLFLNLQVPMAWSCSAWACDNPQG